MKRGRVIGAEGHRMLRISVTDLDSYLYWRRSEDMELAQLIARLRGEGPPTDAMLCGRAFHKLLENAQGEGELYDAHMDGWQFVFAIDEAISLSPIRELKAEVVLETDCGPVTLVGKVDALNGTTVHDYKLTERFDAERYADSYQWRAYLSMFGARSFVYDVFVAKIEGKRAWIHDYHRFPLHTYSDLQRDVLREVNALAQIVAKYVPEKMAA